MTSGTARKFPRAVTPQSVTPRVGSSLWLRHKTASTALEEQKPSAPPTPTMVNPPKTFPPTWLLWLLAFLVPRQLRREGRGALRLLQSGGWVWEKEAPQQC